MTEITILNSQEIEELLTLPMAVEAVEQAYREKSRKTAGTWPMVFHEFVPGQADLDIKSGDMAGLDCYGMKVVSWFGENPDKGLPALHGTTLLFDRKTGEPRALLNAGAITDFRTGAAGALGAKYLARPESEVMTMAGTGALAPYLIAATLLLMPGIRTVYTANPHHPEKTRQQTETICRKVDELLRETGVSRTAEILPEELETAVRKSDVILTATPAREPFLKADWVRPGTHISCVGADMEGKQELESGILETARVFGDDAEQCLSVGECEIPYKTGRLKALTGELGDVLCGAVPGRTSREELTVFDSTGIALQDLAAASALLQAAKKAGKGTRAEL